MWEKLQGRQEYERSRVDPLVDLLRLRTIHEGYAATGSEAHKALVNGEFYDAIGELMAVNSTLRVSADELTRRKHI